MESAIKTIAGLLQRYWLSVGLFLIGLFIFGYGLIVLFHSSKDSQEVVFETNETLATSSSKLMVDISGAVVHPGVYELEADARVNDVIQKAGGLSINADRDWVAHTINLASKITDGTKIYIPSIEEEATGVVEATSDVAGGNAMSLLVNINTASQAELETLSGIGPVTAEKIISHRPYSTITDLLVKKVVGQATFEKIKEEIIAQ